MRLTKAYEFRTFMDETCLKDYYDFEHTSDGDYEAGADDLIYEIKDELLDDLRSDTWFNALLSYKIGISDFKIKTSGEHFNPMNDKVSFIFEFDVPEHLSESPEVLDLLDRFHTVLFNYLDDNWSHFCESVIDIDDEDELMDVDFAFTWQKI